MFEPIVIKVEGVVPVGKERPRFGQRRVFTPEKTLDFETDVRFAAESVMQLRLPLEGALEVTMKAYLPIPKSWALGKRRRAIAGLHRPTSKPDADNLLKSALDPLNGVVFHDDAQVVDARVRKFYADEPGLTIEVRPAPLSTEGARS